MDMTMAVTRKQTEANEDGRKPTKTTYTPKGAHTKDIHARWLMGLLAALLAALAFFTLSPPAWGQPAPTTHAAPAALEWWQVTALAEKVDKLSTQVDGSDSDRREWVTDFWKKRPIFSEELKKLREADATELKELTARVSALETWRYGLGSIVGVLGLMVGFLLRSYKAKVVFTEE